MNLRKISLLILFLLSLNTFSQTNSEIQEIVSKNNAQKNLELIDLATINQTITDEKIEQFLLFNPDVKKKYSSNGKLFQIVDIIDDKPIYRSTLNSNSARSTRTNLLHTGGILGLNLDGQNMHLAVWDGASALVTHNEFKVSNTNSDSRVTTPDFNGSYDDHATHVSGTLIARGANTNAKGMAPQAILSSYNWDNDFNEVTTEAGFNGLLISNHSYGIPVFNLNGTQNAPTWMMGCYNSDAQQWDQLAFNNPYYLYVASAGNDGDSNYSGGLQTGYDKLTGEKNSKNNLVVANASNVSLLPSGQVLSISINLSSSQGPSDDGKVKPDITGDGTDVFSCNSNNDQAYFTSTGTSMSSPNVAGTLILLQQNYNEINSSYLKSATLKGLVCHTADDAGNTGPDPVYGWGLLNAKAAAETILDDSTDSALILETNLANSNTYTKTFSITGTQPLSATICWTDPAGTAQNGVLNSSTPALVNDLDLRLTAPDGTTVFMPWKLQLSNVSAPAINGDNLVDNVENIDIPTPVAGTYTLTVTHKGSLVNSSQDFSLILTGSDLTLGVKENAIQNLEVWPNPTSEILNFRFNSQNSNDVNISLLDIQGRKVYSEQLDGNNSIINGSVNTNDFAQGIYILNIKQGTSQINKRVIIK